MYILAIDQGTSSTKTIVFDSEGKAIARGSEPLNTVYSNNGFVEQDPEGIYRNVLLSVKKCLADLTSKGNRVEDISTVGISNQRETFVVWNEAGKPLYNAVVWQCKRSVEICEHMKQKGWEETVKEKTGLIIDPYFSGSKMIWLKENVGEINEALQNGSAYFGTIDSWLLYRLTGGKSYFTDYTNASRTMFFNLTTLKWDKELTDLFGLAGLNLPQPLPSAAAYGESDFEGMFTRPVTISAMIGDSHAAAFGEQCFGPGAAKATLGTGCSILMNIGGEPKKSGNGMITTVCWSTEYRTDYALEGVIVSCGATIEWLKNELGLFAESRDSEAMANAVKDNNGVYLVPAFSGLGAPHWQMDRKASITGLAFDSNKNHIVRAALESIPYQIKDVIDTMQSDSGTQLKDLRANGGITSNRFVLQFLSDLLQQQVVIQDMPDISALGAAWLAGLKSGIYRDLEHLQSLNRKESVISPGQNVGIYYEGWKQKLQIKDF